MSNDKQQTAVEWFANESWQLKVQLDNQEISVDEYAVFYVRLLYKAKEKEKEQHGKTFHVGVQWIQYQMDSIHGCLEYWDKEPPEFENYYNETYGGNNGRSS